METCYHHEEPGSAHPSLTEEMVLNEGALPGSLKGWRRFRIEYGFECSCPEGLIYLPPGADPDAVEAILNPTKESGR